MARTTTKLLGKRFPIAGTRVQPAVVHGLLLRFRYGLPQRAAPRRLDARQCAGPGQVLAGLVESDDVSGPAASELTASVQQALKAVDDGGSTKAAQAIGRFADFLEQRKKPDQVSGAARSLLGCNAGNILRAFEG